MNDWVCLCDGDTLWTKAPSLLFEESNKVSGNVAIIGSYSFYDHPEDDIYYLKPFGYHIKRKDYFCIGFVLLDMRKYREVDFSGNAKRFIAKNGLTMWLEQDIFNILFQGHSAILPHGWGCNPAEGLRELEFEDIGCFHYFGMLPWPSSFKRRMHDAQALWWYLSHDLMRLPVEEKKYHMDLLLYMVMRFWFYSQPWLPIKGVVEQHRLPIRKLKAQMKLRYLKR